MARNTKDQPKEAIIVESPTKTRSLARFLGGRYKLLATKGHIRDLPERGLAVDVDDGFRPTYQIIPSQKKTVAQLRKELRGVERVYLACDPDREGEAIAWHACETLGLEPDRRARVEFNEITERAVREALEHPHDIDFNRVNAQQARRILDRLVGYLLSPLLQQRLGGWRTNAGALSAGRVQSAALRLIVQRERERAAFVPQEYWRIRAQLKPKDRQEPFEAELAKHRGEDIHIPGQQRAEEITADLRRQRYTVASVEKKEQRHSPPPPFRTATLQREAANKLGWRAGRTMRVAQQLYEGVDLPEGTVGLITYMRTDSTRIAPEARQAARKFIEARYGAEYVGPGSRGRAPRGAQEAHEAIRPTDVARTPEAVAAHLSDDQLALYRLIWRRFVASQMAPAVYDRTRVEISAGDYTLVATGRVLKFPGWRLIYGAETPEENGGNGSAAPDAAAPGGGGEPSKDASTPAGENGRPADQDVAIPELREGEELELLDLKATQHFTQPPPRYTEASLVAELERHGIGRPSTYAPIIDTLRQRKYVRMQRRAFVPTPLGIAVCEYLERFFPQIVDPQFTARMEEKLDAIEAGQADWREVLHEFYDQFRQWLEAAENAPPQVIEGQRCPKCGGQLVERFSRYGRFASCENYPDCDYTRDLGITISETCPNCSSPLEVVVERGGDMTVRCSNPDCDYVRKPAETAGARGEDRPADAEASQPKTCPECGAELTLRTNRRGQKFWGCSRYPQCRYTESVASRRKRSVQTDLDCPECGAKLVARLGRRGWFLGCSNFPKCRFTRNLTAEEREKYLADESGSPPAEDQQDGEAATSSTKGEQTA